jgi:hypothetical protein
MRKLAKQGYKNFNHLTKLEEDEVLIKKNRNYRKKMEVLLIYSPTLRQGNPTAKENKELTIEVPR